MCGLTILPADVAKHPKCLQCLILLEPAFNEKTVCWCGKYHNAPSVRDPIPLPEMHRRAGTGGNPKSCQPERIEEVSDILSEIIQTQ